MANFCVNCGTKLDPNGQCPHCGGAGAPQWAPNGGWADAPQTPPEQTRVAEDTGNLTVRLQNAPMSPEQTGSGSAPQPADPDKTVKAPPAADPDQTVKAPPAADPDQTVKAPPVRPDSESTVAYYGAVPPEFSRINPPPRAPRPVTPPQGGFGAPGAGADKTVAVDPMRGNLPGDESAADYFGPNAMPPHNGFGFGTPDAGGDKTLAANPAEAYYPPNGGYPAQPNGRYTLNVHGGDTQQFAEGATQAGIPMPYPTSYGPNGMQMPYSPDGMQMPYTPDGMQMPYGPNDGHTVAIDPTDDRTQAVDYSGTGYPPYPPVGGEGEGRRKSRAPLIIVIVVLACLLLGSGTLVALQYFEKIDLPVVSDVVEFIFGKSDKKDKESDENKDDKGTENTDDATKPGEPSDPTAPVTPTPAGQDSVSGVVSKDSAGNVILTMDSEKTFNVPQDKQSIYGETVSTRTVRLQAADADKYVGVHATAKGTPTFESANANDKTVTLTGCTFSESNSDRKWNNDHNVTFPGGETTESTTDASTPTTETPDYVGKTVTIRMPNGSSSDSMRVRSAPSYDDSVTTVTSIKNGDKVKVLKEQNGWVQIEVNGKTGWCNAVVAGIKDEPRTTVAVSSVSTSSNARSSDNLNRTYTGTNVTDGNNNTCWMSSGSASGTGEWVQLKLNGTQSIQGIKFLNGNVWKGDSNNPDPYHKTARVKSFTLTFSDGTSKTYIAKDTRENAYGANIFFFDAPVNTDSVRLTVNTVYTSGSGEYSNVVSITEIQVF